MTETLRGLHRTPLLKPVAAAALLVTLMAGCTTVGPDYRAPQPSVDASFIAAGSTQVNAAPVNADIASFWRGFGDAQLNALVERALAANTDVRLAQARLQEARAFEAEARSADRPSIGLDASAQRAVTPITQAPGTSRSARTGNALDASFIAAWELDLFGGVRRSSEAAAARVSASEAGIGAAHTAVAAEVARGYLELRGLQQRLRVTEDSLTNQRDALRITSARVEAGRGTDLDAARARGLVASTEATLPSLQAAIEATVFRLATLTARPPRELLAELTGATGSPATQVLPGLPVTDLASLPVGTPQQWLQRRPDLQVAERNLAAATADIGVATAALYPRLSLSGLLGLNAATFGGLGRAESARYAVGAALSWTPFDGGALRARIRASEARAAQSLAQFESTLYGALEETEGAFSSYTRSAQRAERLEVAVSSTQDAATLARKRYDAGVTDFLSVLDAERELLVNRDQLVQARVGVATALVAVYRALGGGWTPDAAVVAKVGGT